MKHFNLIDEAWIPIRFLDGSRGELGIQETFRRAKEIASIEDASPLVIAALHRLLLAILYRALRGPCSLDEAKSLFRNGLPQEKIRAYLNAWQERFWLFHETHPFGQHPGVDEKEREPWTKLTHEFNSTTNKVLFDHTDTRSPGGVGLSACARWLCTTMGFSISGGRGYYPSPSPNAMHCIPCGCDLQQTLLYNLVPQANRDVEGMDTAVWENDPPRLPLPEPKRLAKGLADLFTFQSRFIRLEMAEDGLVHHVGFIAGWGYERNQSLLDPMQAHRMDKKEGPKPIGFNDRKATWREFDTLLPAKLESSASATLQHALNMGDGTLPASLFVLGLRYEPPNANLDFWRMERFHLPGALKRGPEIQADIKSFLQLGEESQSALWSACNGYARRIIGRGERKPDKKDIQAFLNQMPCIPAYWASLEVAFHTMLQDFTVEANPYLIRRNWLASVRDALQASWNLHTRQARTGDAWAIRALVQAEGAIWKESKRLGQLIQELDDYLKEDPS